MDYEKKYKEALEKARQLSAYPVCWPFISDLQDLFPELVESEDKKIREAVYNCVKWFGFDSCFFKDVSQEECLGWIEKQGEKKPILDVEIPFGAKDSELEEVSYDIPKGYHAEIEDDKVVIKKGEQKPIKHNNDSTIDSNLNDYCCNVYNALHKENGGNLSFERLQHLAMDIYKWCKEQHTHAEWSKEDEFHFKSIESTIEYCKKEVAENDDARYNEDLNWLKSLKDRYAWKPSDEKMEYLAKAITTLGDEGDCETALILNNLRFELKKLRKG